MEIRFYTNLHDDSPPIHIAHLPMPPRVGETVMLTDSPGYKAWIVADVVYELVSHSPDLWAMVRLHPAVTITTV